MIKFIRHYFLPRTSNNHRSKILHNSSLFVIVILLLFSSWFSIIVNKTNPQILGISYSISNQELLLLVNEQRLENNLPPLKLNEKLSSAASAKANHMFANNYWAHFAPDGTSPWKFITDNGYDYIYAGENLAKGFVTAEDAVDAWMESPSHRDNILSAQYKEVGFSIVEGSLQGEDTVLIVEMFGQEKNQFLAKAEVDADSINQTQVDESQVSEDPDVNDVVEVPLLGTNDVFEAKNGVEEIVSQATPVVDLFSSTKTISFILTAVLLIAFLLDLFVVARKRIPRIVGDNLDHILLLTIFIVFMFIYNLGVIL